MRSFTWNRFPIKNLLIDSLLSPIVESTYLNRDMCKFESSQKGESRWQSTDSSKAFRNTIAFKFASSYAYSQIYWSRTKLQKLSYCHIGYFKTKTVVCTCSEMLNPVQYFTKHSIQSYAALPVAVANASKSQLFKVCCWCWTFAEITWNISDRSKATWAQFFLVLLGYRKQIIQNLRKTVKSALTINVCLEKISCKLFPLATAHP